MSGVDGKKLKLHLGALKQSLDAIIINTSTASPTTTTGTGTSSTASTSTSKVHKLFQLILITELAQRGIVIPYSDSDSAADNDEDTDDIVLLWNGITSTAGRECLNTANANVKPPLIAGAAIVSALAVQKLSRALQNVQSNNNKLITMTTCMCMKQTDEMKMEMEAAYRRCIAVEDERLATLLNIGIQAGIIPHMNMNMPMNMNIHNNNNKGPPGPPGPPPGPPIAEEEEIIVNLPAVILACHQITRGNYQRASSYSNRDAPPLFKKTLESVLNYQHAMDYLVQVQVATGTANEYEYDDEDKSVVWREDDSINEYMAHETPMTIEPLLNLRRIAAMKQNHKRSSELSLRVVQAYLNLSNSDDSKSDSEKERLEKYILTSHAWKNLWEGMMEAFVHQSTDTDTDDGDDGDDTHTKNKKGKKLQLQVELARKMLDSFDLSLFDNDDNDDDNDDDDGQEMMILYHLLKVRVGMQTEETIVKTVGGERYTTSRNRTGVGMGIGSSAASTAAKPSTSTSTGGGKSKTFKKKVIASVKKTAPLPTTREGCEDMVRRELLSYTLSQDDIDSVPVEYEYEYESKGEKMEEAAVVLRDVYLQKCSEGEGEGAVSCSYVSLIDHVCICLQQHIERLVLRAQSIMRLNRKKKKTRDVNGIGNAWRALLEYIAPLMALLGPLSFEGGKEEEEEEYQYVLNMTLAKRNLLKCAAETMLTTAWMTMEYSSTLGTTTMTNSPIPSLDMIQRVTSYLISHLQAVQHLQRVRKQKLLEKEGKIVRTRSASSSSLEQRTQRQILESEQAIRGGRAHLVLASLSSMPVGGGEGEDVGGGEGVGVGVGVGISVTSEEYTKEMNIIAPLTIKAAMTAQSQSLSRNASGSSGSGSGSGSGSASLSLSLSLASSTSALPSLSKFTSEINAKYGTPFLQFMACWGGWHGTPWNYCNVSQARAIVQYATEYVNRVDVTSGAGTGTGTEGWGRRCTIWEGIILALGEADAECGFLSGGFTARAKILYGETLAKLDDGENGGVNGDGIGNGNTSISSILGKNIVTLIKTHCITCLVKISLATETKGDYDVVCLDAAEKAKSSIESLQMSTSTADGTDEDVDVSSSCFYPWRGRGSLSSSIQHHISFTRQLVAEAYLGASRPMEAQIFLKDAVKATPKNYEVAFAYGSFCLRMALYENEDGDNGSAEIDTAMFRKKAQSQLVKAAKLNTKQADPFSLLGVWYEVQGDFKRATGCYSKALLMDPSHPVAGRGILRLKSSKDASTLCQRALNFGTFQNGWAWKSSGDAKALIEGDDEKAILCYQQALRCHDIENPRQHRLGIFFRLPRKEIGNGHSYGSMENIECSNLWTSLGGCYRRLGKFSAALRTFQSAYDIAPSDLSYYCSWAQVELELGLLDECMDKFNMVLDADDVNTRYNAAFGLASCMLLSARRKAEEGKSGDALACLQKGIESLSSLMQGDGKTSEVTFYCAFKLLGDLHNAGSILPSSVFNGTKQKISFIEKGEDAYKEIVKSVENRPTSVGDEEEGIVSILTKAYSDIGINILLRARILGEMLHEGSGLESSTILHIAKEGKIGNLLDLAIGYFMESIETNQSSPLAWCGLGCSLVSTDPLLAQHAFVRALELNKASEDAWANMSLLHLNYGKIVSSEEAVDALTQVADTPLMWISRGLLLEKAASKVTAGDSDSFIYKAADAYRASLQISRHHAALLGLSLTCRRLGCDEGRDDYAQEARAISFKESDANLKMFLHTSGETNIGANAFSGIMDFEKGSKMKKDERSGLAELLVTSGNHALAAVRKALASKSLSVSNEYPKPNKTSIIQPQNDLNMPFPSFSNEAMMKLLDSTESIALDVSTKTILSEALSNKATSSAHISRARQAVVEDPGSGESWLRFSKELIKALEKNKTETGHESVKAAISRTKQIMISDGTAPALLHPTISSQSSKFTAHRSVSSTPIAASLLSEALALSHCVEDIACSKKRSIASCDLQRSLLLDPTNRFARALV